MDMVSPILDVATRLCNCISVHAYYIIKLEDTMTSLRTEMGELKDKRYDVEQKVQLEEQQGKIQSKEVEGWLRRVQETETRVNEICEKHEEISSHGSTCLRVCHCQSSYKLGKRATKALHEVQELISKGVFSEISIQQPRPAQTTETEGLDEIPMPNHPVGIESNLEKVLNGLKTEDVGIIGLYGMGGVGKTTLLKKVNNNLPKSGDDAFDLAIWVVASKNATTETIQQSITKRLSITLSDKYVDEIRNEIYKALKKMRYILMLDDVWKKLDLFEKVGIPKPDNRNRSKIILTTRSEGVCFQMGADPIIKVECLSWEEAWSLFKEKVGKAILSPQIESYAMKIAKECKGLPLALSAIGSTMSGKKDPYEWSHALDQLQNCPTKLPNVEEEVFHALQLSYDYLADINKECFLYCSLFPEDHDIDCDELVRLWMGEGYLNKNHDDIKKARDFGYSIIADLKRACLLENGSLSETVKMHDMIRDMALRIVDKKFLVLEEDKFMKAKNNEDVEKMSMWRDKKDLTRIWYEEEDLTLTHEYSKLSTLLLHCQIYTLERLQGLFSFVPNVRVLDLSNNVFRRHLPKEISILRNLEYLDISFTGIIRLPKEMRSLGELRYLLMNYIIKLEECPSEIVGGLSNLLMLSMNELEEGSNTQVLGGLPNSLPMMIPGPPISKELLRVLEELQNIQEISICLESDETIDYFLKSKKLQLLTRCITLCLISYEVVELNLNNMRNLEYLVIKGSDLIGLKFSVAFNCLRSVSVYGCDNLVELDFLAYAPSLTLLVVHTCRSIERIVRVEEAEGLFSSLRKIELLVLESLKYICNKPLSFPALEEITIKKCYKLEQNPFKGMKPTDNKLRMIDGERGWWNSLKWSDDSLKHYFSPFFKNTDEVWSTNDEESDEYDE